MYQKQAAFLRIVRDNPGVTNNGASRIYREQTTDASKHNVKCLLAMMDALPPSGKHAGRPAYCERREGGGIYLTPEGVTAIADYDKRNGFVYRGKPMAPRFDEKQAAAAHTGSVVAGYTDPNGGAQPFPERDPEAPTPRRRAWEMLPGRKPSPEPRPSSKGGDLSLYNIRSALQEARSVHEKILESRGGPQVLVDIRFTAIIRALDLLVERLYGGGNPGAAD